MSRRAWMWIAFQVAHVTFSFSYWTVFLLGLYETYRDEQTQLFGPPRWGVVALLVLVSPVLYAVAFRLRKKTVRPHLSGGRRRWRGVLLALWAVFSISVGGELFLPEGHVRLAIAYGGLAALAWWGAWRIERAERESGVAGRVAEPTTA